MSERAEKNLYQTFVFLLEKGYSFNSKLKDTWMCGLLKKVS